MARRSRNPALRLDILLSSGKGIRFNKRHYEFLAAIFRENRTSWGLTNIQTIARAFADAFERDNPFFNRTRFLEAVEQEGDMPDA